MKQTDTVSLPVLSQKFDTCTHCGKKLVNNVLKERYSKKSSFAFDEATVCPNCICDLLQFQKQLAANKYLKRQLHTRIGSLSNKWC